MLFISSVRVSSTVIWVKPSSWQILSSQKTCSPRVFPSLLSHYGTIKKGLRVTMSPVHIITQYIWRKTVVSIGSRHFPSYTIRNKCTYKQGFSSSVSAYLSTIISLSPFHCQCWLRPDQGRYSLKTEGINSTKGTWRYQKPAGAGEVGYTWDLCQSQPPRGGRDL